MNSYKAQKRKSIKDRMLTLKEADEFAKQTFIALRKDDTCLKRFLRFLRIIPQQKL